MPTKTNAQKAAEAAAAQEAADQAANEAAGNQAPAATVTAGDGQAEQTVAAAVVDAAGQVDPNGPQATPTAGIRAGVLDRRQYAQAGEGFQPGEAAPKDVWLDTRTNKVVTKQPEQGQVLAIKGSPVDPWVARLLSEQKFKG